MPPNAPNRVSDKAPPTAHAHQWRSRQQSQHDDRMQGSSLRLMNRGCVDLRDRVCGVWSVVKARRTDRDGLLFGPDTLLSDPGSLVLESLVLEPPMTDLTGAKNRGLVSYSTPKPRIPYTAGCTWFAYYLFNITSSICPSARQLPIFC